MAEQTTFPRDLITKLPLLILPNRPSHNRGAVVRHDYDHSFFPRNDPLLQGLGGKAVRYCMGQLMARPTHERKNEAFNHVVLPQTEDEQFQVVLAACAGIVGPYAVDLTKDDYLEPVLMTPQQYVFATDPVRLYIQGARRVPGSEQYGPPSSQRHVRNHIGRFYASYALSRDLDHISPRLIKKFLGARDPARRMELGNLLLRETIAVSIEPVVALRRSMLERTPPPANRPRDLIKEVRKFFIKEHFVDYHDVLAVRLARSAPAHV